MFFRYQPQLKPWGQLARRLKWNRSASSGENDAMIHPFDARMNKFQTRMIKRTKGLRSLKSRDIRGDWNIWSTRSNNSKPSHTIRHQMTNLTLAPYRKGWTYWRRRRRLNVRTGGRRCIVWRKNWLIQGISNLRQW